MVRRVAFVLLVSSLVGLTSACHGPGGSLAGAQLPAMATCASLAGSNGVVTQGRSHPLPAASRALAPEQKRRAEMLTSLFENSTLELQYGYAEALGDGRGITAGRAGFTSGTGDMLMVVTNYTQRNPQNPLAVYLPTLRKLAAAASGSTKGLKGLIPAWGKAAQDPIFRQVQDETVDTMYYTPAMALALQQGVQSALGEAVLYDTIIQHGDGDDLDGLPALIERTNAALGGSPAKGIAEAAWLARFLAVRRADLAFAFDPDTREVWAASVTRCDALASILAAGNLQLAGPFHLAAGGYDCVIP